MSNFDLDVNNYSVNALKNFFSLNDADTFSTASKKIEEITNMLLSSENIKHDLVAKHKLSFFINQAKEILLAKYHASLESMILKLNPATKENSFNSGLVSGAPHFVQQINSYPEKYVNQTEFNYRTRLIILNSIYSDSGTTSTNGSYTFTLPETIKNVTGITLAALQYPNVELAFSDYKGNNLMYIQENYTNTTDPNGNPTTSDVDGNSATIRVPPGTYSVTNFPPVLQSQINLALGYPTSGTDSSTTSIFDQPRYSVSINPNSYQTTITNNLDPINTAYPLSLAYSKTLNGNNNFFSIFTMVFDKPTWTSNASSVCVSGLQENPLDPNVTVLPEDYEGNTLQYRSLGYQMGFRNIINSGVSSYTSRSVYNSNIINYVYFALDDFIANRMDEVTGIFFGSLLDKNILALIPITAAPFTSTLDSGANFIFKTRNYGGPVNLKKFNVTFYDPNGFITQLNGTPFVFALELKIAYENPALISKKADAGLQPGFSEAAI
jgi:hypothetical protein